MLRDDADWLREFDLRTEATDFCTSSALPASPAAANMAACLLALVSKRMDPLVKLALVATWVCRRSATPAGGRGRAALPWTSSCRLLRARCWSVWRACKPRGQRRDVCGVSMGLQGSRGRGSLHV